MGTKNLPVQEPVDPFAGVHFVLSTSFHFRNEKAIRKYQSNVHLFSNPVSKSPTSNSFESLNSRNVLGT